jgi:hypothetical protein
MVTAIHTEERQLLINNFIEYKGTMKKYCEENNIKYRTFRGWLSKSKLTSKHTKKEEQSTTTKDQNNFRDGLKSKFIKFTIPQTEIMKVRLPNGLIVEVLSKNLSIIIKELAHVVF